MSDLMLAAVCAPILALGLGFIIGGRMSDGYWADHGEYGGLVHHKGKFYRVTKEDGSR